MTINITVPNTSSDSLTFGSGNTPTAAQVIGIDSGSSNGQLAFNTTASGTSTEAMRITAAQNVGIGTTSPSTRLTIGRVDSSNEGGQIDLCRSSDNTSAWAIDVFGNTSTPSLRFVDNVAAAERVRIDSSGNVGIGTSSPSKKLDVNGSINANSIEVGLNGESIKKASGSLYIETGSANPLIFTTNSAERMRIDSSGNLLVGTTSSLGGAARLNVSYNYTNDGARWKSDSTNVHNAIVFMNPNGDVGTIRTTGSSTTYNTSSDYRLKENIAPMTGALSVVQQLKPCTYTWKADGSDGQGFIAHELQEVVPDCVTGEKDAVDENGNPVYQGIDTSFLVATLTAAIQELKAIVDAQAVEIAALKGTA